MQIAGRQRQLSVRQGRSQTERESCIDWESVEATKDLGNKLGLAWLSLVLHRPASHTASAAAAAAAGCPLSLSSSSFFCDAF